MQFLYDHGVAIFFGSVGLILAAVGVFYARAQARTGSSAKVNASKYLKLYFSREAMVEDLLGMYARAAPSDTIWGQCVSCAGYSPSVKQDVLDASSRGVRFEIIVNTQSPRKQELLALYQSIKSAKVVERSDNDVSMQGLSSKEVIISLPEVSGYCALKISQPNIVAILRAWFENRLGSEQIAVEAGVT